VTPAAAGQPGDAGDSGDSGDSGNIADASVIDADAVAASLGVNVETGLSAQEAATRLNIGDQGAVQHDRAQHHLVGKHEAGVGEYRHAAS